ncbi:MAG: SDR family oxidoreductase [Silicimonas sp.]|nr:SDR family oxidoreductase [Silicimonas sp.]
MGTERIAMAPQTRMCSADNLAKDLSGKTYIVTGANSGVGLEVTRQLARQKAAVIMACRNTRAAQPLADEINEKDDGNAKVMALDLGSLASVREFVTAFNEGHDGLDGLVNNAGVMNTPKGVTDDGFETQFGVNHLGPFLLSELLLPVLKASAPSRIIATSSVYHENGDLDFDDLNWTARKYDGFQAYHDSKLALVLYARHLGQRLEDSGVTSVSLHPGWVQSNLASHTMPLWVQNFLAYPVLKLMGMISPWEGAQTTLHCLLDDGVTAHNGAYFSQVGTLYKNKADRPGGWPMASPSRFVGDDALGARLYDVSAELVGLT